MTAVERAAPFGATPKSMSQMPSGISMATARSSARWTCVAAPRSQRASHGARGARKSKCVASASVSQPRSQAPPSHFWPSSRYGEHVAAAWAAETLDRIGEDLDAFQEVWRTYKLGVETLEQDALRMRAEAERLLA